MIDQIVANAPVFMLVAVRCFAMIMTLPLFSSKSVPRIAKLAVAGYTAYFIFPMMQESDSVYSVYRNFVDPEGRFDLVYILLLAGEGLIGILLGLFVQIIFASFSTAGQFFAFQMGLSASEVYDSLSQVENPLMGQFFNFLAMLVFLQSNLFTDFFISGITKSFTSMNAFSLVVNDVVPMFLLKSLARLFFNALLIALPLMGSLFLINVTVGILSKAAPQMNLLSEGFPILMIVSYWIIAQLIPFFVSYFGNCIYTGVDELMDMFVKIKGGK